MGIMSKDIEFVIFPCDKPSWPRVRNLLEDLKDIAQNESHDLKRLAIFHQKIVDISQGFDDPPRVGFGETQLHGLTKFLSKYATPEERRKFLQSTFPTIINLVLELPNVKPVDGLIINSQYSSCDTELNRNFVASILACAFLCMFEDRGKPWKTGDKLNVINFSNFYRNLPCPSQNAKVRCILNYFERISDRRFNLQGNIRFIRQVIDVEELPTLDIWLNCEVELCPLIVHHEGCIEDAGFHAIEVDFANRFIGGGVIGRGRVQEEIRFCVCPELIASMLFMEVMDDNEAIIIQGYEQFSKTEGYAGSLSYAGDHQDLALYDDTGNLLNTLCAIDAVSYKTKTYRQYSDEYCVRDLNKAYVGFSANVSKAELQTVSEDRSCDMLYCNQSENKLHSSEFCDKLPPNSDDDEYETASESEMERDDQQVSNAIFNLADGLLVDILASALLEASTILCRLGQERFSKVKTNLTVDGDNTQSFSSFGSRNSNYDNMDHLDIDLRDWVTKFRRRSSNLSDIGSRRSSCSTRYSSDFSSEFEEYYENFQRKEQSFIHNTITEETSNHVICDFASSLVSKLLQEGTTEAIQSQPGVQDFCDSVPEEVITKPKARKVSEEEEDSVSSQKMSQEIAERFAESLLSKLFVFPNDKHNSCEAQNDTNVNSSIEKNIPFKAVHGQPNDIINAINIDLKPSLDCDYVSLGACQSGEVTNHKNESSSSDDATDVHEKTSDDVDFKYKAMKIVQFAISGAYQKLESIPDTCFSDQVQNDLSVPKPEINFLSPSAEDGALAAACCNDSSVACAVDNSSALNAGSEEIKRLDHTNDSRPGSTSPSRKNVQFHKDIVQSDEGKTFLDFDSLDHDYFEPSNLHNSTTLSDSSTSLESAGHIKIIPRVLVTDEVSSPEDLIEEMYGRIAEKLIVSGVSSALREVQHSTGRSYEGSSLTFSSTKSQPEHSLFVHSGNLIYPGEILRGDSFEDVSQPKRVNYFANSLSRDLLTNAFVEVQRNVNGANYARRSSEPLKISNQAARQLMENTKNGIHGFFCDKTKSRTEEDLGTFAEELARRGSFDDFRRMKSRWPCGFRDPTLSRFAEELMKTECKVPELKLLDSSTQSLSGSSSTSFLSSKSGFQDPVLSSFEEELLFSCHRRSSSRGSYKRKSRKSGVLSKQRNLGADHSSSCNENQNADKSKRGMSFDSEMSAVSWRSFPSSQSYDEVSDFAERLTQRIMKESFQTVFRDVVLPADPYKSPNKPPVVKHAVLDFAEQLTADIMVQAFHCVSDADKKSKRGCVVSSVSSSATETSSEEFTDALCIPFSKLEEFADKIAKTVMQTSVGFMKREVDCLRKRFHGRPISTGNWGCGAYRGDAHLKSMIQWMAASYAGVPCVLYYTFHREDLLKLQDVVDSVICRGWKVGQLMQAVRTYNLACQDCDVKPDLFELLLDPNSFTDIT